MAVPIEALTVMGLSHADPHARRLRLVPDFVAPSVAQTDFAEIRRHMGLADSDPLHVLSDLDGTLRVAEADTVDAPTANHVRESLASGAITSFTITPNSVNPGISRFGWQIGKIPTYSSLQTGYRKPHAKFYRHVIQDLGIGGEPTLIMGDKVTRDILGARRIGAVSLQVPPLGGTDLMADRLIGRRFDNVAGVLGAWLLQGANRYESLFNML